MIKKVSFAFLFVFIFILRSYSDEIIIVSDKLEIDRVNNISIFSGNVHVYEDDLEIWADKITVKFNYSENEVEEMLAENNVRILRENITATGNLGFYYPILEEINMFENIEVIEDDNLVKCDELFLDIKNSISIMKGNSKTRVEAIIVSEN